MILITNNISKVNQQPVLVPPEFCVELSLNLKRGSAESPLMVKATVFGEVLDVYDPSSVFPDALVRLCMGKQGELPGKQYYEKELKLAMPLVAIEYVQAKSIPEWLGGAWLEFRQLREKKPGYLSYLRFYPHERHSDYFKFVFELRRKGRFDELSKNRIERLLQLFSEDPDRRKRACRSLDKMGPAITELLLHKAKEDPDPYVASEIWKFLNRSYKLNPGDAVN